jgi:hypothetical protein
MMPKNEDVQTGIPDLTGVELSQLLRDDNALVASTTGALVRRVDQAHHAISGYNPQRLD